jgi:hypothetical protein
MTIALAASSPATRTSLAIFGPPPLLEGEDPAAYDALLARVSEAVRPADMLEEIWVRDVVDLAWEAFRMRRLKTNLLTANVHKGLNEILETFRAWDEPEGRLAKNWAAREPDAIKQVTKLLAAAGLTMDAVRAQTLSLKIDDIERIDCMILNAGARRDAVLREVDRHRASLGQASRRASDGAEEAQLVVVETKQIADQSAA